MSMPIVISVVDTWVLAKEFFNSIPGVDDDVKVTA